MIRIIDSKIINRNALSKDIFSLVLSAPEIAAAASPGNFVEIKVSHDTAPLLRRPFSIGNVVDGNGIEIVYKTVGIGTEMLSRKNLGDAVSIIGPLGNHFKTDKAGAALLVAGGIGLPPIMYLAGELKKEGKPFGIVFGARSEADIIYRDELEELTRDVIFVTEDGSKGEKGLVTTYMPKMISSLRKSHENVEAFSCGPTPMLKAVAACCAQNGIEAQVSLETYMACGFGACMGCIVDTIDGYKRVCKEGPVFDAKKVVF